MNDKTPMDKALSAKAELRARIIECEQDREAAEQVKDLRCNVSVDYNELVLLYAHSAILNKLVLSGYLTADLIALEMSLLTKTNGV